MHEHCRGCLPRVILNRVATHEQSDVESGSASTAVVGNERSDAADHLGALRTTRGLSLAIQADNGPELRGRVLDQWAYKHGVRLQFIEPGKPIKKEVAPVV